MAYEQKKDPAFSGQNTSAPKGRAVQVTPADSDLGVYASALLVMADGNLSFIPAKNTDAEALGPYAVTAGTLIPIRTRQVKAATTATVLALFD